MAQEKIFDRNSKILGFLQTESNGQVRLFDKSSNLLGWYEPKTNQAFDRSSRFIGKGMANLSMLLRG